MVENPSVELVLETGTGLVLIGTRSSCELGRNGAGSSGVISSGIDSSKCLGKGTKASESPNCSIFGG